MRYVVHFIGAFLLAAPAWAGQRELTEERARMLSEGRTLTAQEETQLSTRGWRDRRSQETLVPVTNRVRPADYTNDVHRGTIELLPRWRNYSYHVTKAPDGTMFDGAVMGGCNFTQIAPATEAFDRSTGFGHNLRFRGCNLVNVKTYPDWTIEACNTAQIDRVGTLNADGSANVTNSVVVGSDAASVNPNRSKPGGVLE